MAVAEDRDGNDNNLEQQLTETLNSVGGGNYSYGAGHDGSAAGDHEKPGNYYTASDFASEEYYDIVEGI